MLIVFLKIIKFIGWIILGLVLLLLALLFMVLIVPVRYKVAGEAGNKKGLSLKANISYLFHIISVWIIYEKKLIFKIKIFGINIGFNKNKKLSNNKKEKNNKGQSINKVSAEDISEFETNAKPQTIEKTDTDNRFEENSQSDIANVSEKNEQSDNTNETEEVSDSGGEEVLENIVEKEEKGESTFDKVSAYIDLLTSDDFKAAFSTVKYRVGKLLRSVLPKRGKIFLKFGSGDAGLIGKIFGYYEALYPFIGHVFTFIPVFTDKQFESDIDIKGRILPGVCFYQLIRIYLDKNCRRIINMFIKKK